MALKPTASLLLTFVLSASAAGAKTPPVEWVIVQDSTVIGGDVLYVTKDAVKIKARHEDFEIVAKAPSWKRYCFRRSERIMYVSQVFGWDQMFAGYKKSGTVGVFQKIGTAEYKGVHCTKYLEPALSVISLTADDIKIDPGAADVISDYFNIPKFRAVPLYNAGHKRAVRKYKTRDWLSDDADIGTTDRNYKVRTVSCTKSSYNAADFEVPTGYKLCDNANAIVLSAGKKKEIESFIENLGFAPTGKESKNKTGPK